MIEQQYLDLVTRIIDTGFDSDDRTGTGTRCVLGATMRFDLRCGFPLLTTKRVFIRGIIEELLWFLRGSTNANELSAVGVNIWTGNTTEEFLRGRGLEYAAGDIGPGYGFQWRHCGAEYSDCTADYSGKGVDQLANCIHLIKTDPNSRRIIMSAWNPVDVPKMALPPCHMIMQFRVTPVPGTSACDAPCTESAPAGANGNSVLNLFLTQRSGDVGLGVPFNIASYSLLLIIVAKMTGLVAGEFIHTINDAHIYRNHIDTLREQVTREPRALPTMTIADFTDISELTSDHFKLTGYKPHPAIKMDMAI